MSRPLNPKQSKFAQRVIATSDPIQSYIDAYGKMDRDTASKAASRLLKNVEIKALIAKGTGRALQTAELDAAYVIAGLKKEAEREDESAQHAARIKAYELLGKILRMWDEGEKPKDEGSTPGAMVEHITRLLAVFGARKPDGGAGGGTAGGAAAGNPVVPERRPPEPGVPE